MPENDDVDHVGEALTASRQRRPLEAPRKPDTPPTFAIVAGMVIVVLGGLLAGLGTGFFAVLGGIVGVLGLVIAGIGVVAAGVRLGTQWADYDRAMRHR